MLYCAATETDSSNCGGCGQTCVACEQCSLAQCTATSFLNPSEPLSGVGLNWGGAVADVDHDGLLDIAVLTMSSLDPNYDADTITVFFGDGDGGFSRTSTLEIGSTLDVSLLQIAAGDLNGDGYNQLFVATQGLDAGDAGFMVVGEDGGSLVLLGVYESELSPLVGLGGGFQPGLAIGDLNGDGRSDVIFETPEVGLELVYSQGGGNFSTDTTMLGDVCDGGYIYSYPPPGAIAVGDLNGDGLTDLAVACTYFGSQRFASVAILLQTADGGLGPPQILWPYLFAPDLIAITPGRLDATFSNNNGPFGLNSYSFSQDGGLSLVPQTITFSSGLDTYAYALSETDMNGDGIPDVVVLFQNAVAVLLAHPDAGIGAPVDFLVQASNFSFPTFLSMGDLNGDHRPDVAVGLSETGISLYFNECIAPGP
jgi:hypothetical protein